MCELDHKERWVPKNWCFQTVVLEKTLESPLHYRRSNQSLLRKSILNINWKTLCWSWSSNTLATWCKELTHWKDTDAEKDRRQEEKGMTENEMVGWHRRLDGHEFEQALGDDEGQGSLACCNPWGHKESDTTEWLNSNNKGYFTILHDVCHFSGTLCPSREREGAETPSADFSTSSLAIVSCLAVLSWKGAWEGNFLFSSLYSTEIKAIRVWIVCWRRQTTASTPGTLWVTSPNCLWEDLSIQR